MFKIASKNNHWACYVPLVSDKRLPVNSIDVVMEAIEHFPHTLKNDKRSVVKRGELFGKDVVAKQPVDKNKRRWARLLSLVRYGEARKTMLTLSKFKQLGIPSVTPLLVLEKRRYGFLIDSWIIYEYRDGLPCGKAQLPGVVALLKTLHQQGFRHDDPNFGNFLLSEQNELFLIDCKGRPRLGGFTDCYDYYLLAQRNAHVTMTDIKQNVLLNEASWGYRFAHLYVKYKSLRNDLKNKIRNR